MRRCGDRLLPTLCAQATQQRLPPGQHACAAVCLKAYAAYCAQVRELEKYFGLAQRLHKGPRLSAQDNALAAAYVKWVAASLPALMGCATTRSTARSLA